MLKAYLQENGATSTVVDTGFVINSRLAAAFNYLAGKGGKFNGGLVKFASAEASQFLIVFDSLF